MFLKYLKANAKKKKEETEKEEKEKQKLQHSMQTQRAVTILNW